MNKACLIGHLGKDPEFKQINDRLSVCKFSLATSDKIGKDKITEWHNIVAWNRIGEVLSKYLQKGSKVYIEGRIKKETWEKEGTPRERTTVIVNQFEFLDSRSQTQQPQTSQSPGFDSFADDNLPF